MQDDYILVVGGAGYIGSHTNLKLFSCGYKTVVFDNLVYGHREMVKWGEFFEGDLGSEKDLRNLFQTYKINTVIHFAAYAYVGESVVDPQKYYINNVSNTLNLLKIMREFKVTNIVFSSSCAVYGLPAQIPISESCSTNPINPYGMSKLMVENILSDYSGAYGIKYVSLRYFNAAGADSEGRAGELHSPETHLIPLAIEAAINDGHTLKVYGSDYETPDGTCVRDYIHVSDLANAHVLALEYLIKGGDSEIFNLGNGNGYSVQQIINSVEAVSNRSVKYMIDKRRPGDPPILVSDSDKVSRVLNWRPVYTDIDAIIITALNFRKALTSG